MTWTELSERVWRLGARLTLIDPDDPRGASWRAAAERVASRPGTCGERSAAMDVLGLTDAELAAEIDAWMRGWVGELSRTTSENPRARGAELLRIPGVGPARARAIVERFGVDSIADVASLSEAKLCDVPGIGPARARELLREARSVAGDTFERVIGRLRCPATGQPVRRRGEAVVPDGGGRTWPIRDGVVDFVGGPPREQSPSQRLMETVLYSRGYEQLFRPALTRLVTRQAVPDSIELSLVMLDLASDADVLDVACGTGNFTRAIASRAPDGLVVGLDRSEPMLAEAERVRVRDGIDNVRFVRGDALRLPFAASSFSAAHCAAALHLMPDPDAALRELHRVVRPGGRLVVMTFVRSSTSWVRRAQLASVRFTGFEWFAPDALLRRISEAGFRIREEVIEGAAITVAAERLG